MSNVGRLVYWTDEDGTVYVGRIRSEQYERHAGLDMDLTLVVIDWEDGSPPTQHTLEALVQDPRVQLKP